MNIEYKPFTIEAYDIVLELWESCDGVGLSSSDSREAIEIYLERNPGMSFLALEAGKIVGTVLGGHDGRRGYIHHLAVLPEARRQRIGEKLVDLCLEELKKEQIHKCHLFIFFDNDTGIQFWESIGWEFRKDIGVISKDV